jgi:large subunit ribosomal protein L6
MSRIGRMPITVPAGVTVTVGENNYVVVKGPKGTLEQQLNARMNITQNGNEIVVTRPTDEKEDRSVHGLTRALLNNMVVGVTTGYSKKLEVIGVGYKVAMQGTKLVLNLGYSHPIHIEQPADLKIETPDANTIIVSGADKQAVGQLAAVIRSKRPPEPYHGKGVKYSDEYIRRKAGKTGK